MHRMWVLCLCVILSSPAAVLAGEAGGDDGAAAPPSVSEPASAAGSTGGKMGSTGAVTGDSQAAAREAHGGEEPETREMSGMSVVGNDEAPKSLTIVPWKSAEMGVQTSLDTMLNESDTPVDREVFRRQVDFYLITTGR